MAYEDHLQDAPEQIGCAVITVSDTRDENTDKSGQLIKELLAGKGHKIVRYAIVKDSLLTYPVFGHVMRSRNPIAVGRSNPREDLKAVMEGGKERLGNGVSLIIFPQTTRTPAFDPAEFNTLGVKLARRADVPVVPLALVTDAWGTGKRFKDFGKIDPSKAVHLAFGEPMRIEGRGEAEHEAIIEFIQGNLKAWGATS